MIEMQSNETGSLDLWLKTVRDLIGVNEDTLTVIDLCCGEMTNTKRMSFRASLHVDVNDWPTRPREAVFSKVDALSALGGVPAGGYDLALCSDGLEHLSKDDGLKLLSEMSRVARMAIIFTPLGDLRVDPYSTHPDTHKSGWIPDELQGLGWDTYNYPNWHESLGSGAFFAVKTSLCHT